MTKVYVFDLDGTLVDSMSYYIRGLLKILDDAGIPYGDEMVNIITPLGYTKSAEYFIGMGVESTVEELVAQMQENLLHEYAENIRLKPFVGDFLRKIKAEGARLFVLTASPHSATDACLKNNGVYELFERIWSVEEFGLTKTDTRIFLEAARQIGCEPSEVNYFEDNMIAVRNATAAGFNTFGVKDMQSESDLEDIRKTAGHFINSFEEML